MKYFIRDVPIPSFDPAHLIQNLSDRIGIKKTAFRYELVSASASFINGQLVYAGDFCIETMEFIRRTTISFSEALVNPPKGRYLGKGSPIIVGDSLSGLYAAAFLSLAGAKPILLSQAKEEKTLGYRFRRTGGFLDLNSVSPFGKHFALDILARIEKKSFSRFTFISHEEASKLVDSLTHDILSRGGTVLYGCQPTSIKTFLGKAKAVEFLQQGKVRALKGDCFLLADLPMGSPLYRDILSKDNHREPSYLNILAMNRTRDVDVALYHTLSPKEPRYFHYGQKALLPFPFGSAWALKEGNGLYACPSIDKPAVLGHSLAILYVPLPSNLNPERINEWMGNQSYRDSLPLSLPSESVADCLKGSEPYSFGLVRGQADHGFHLASLPGIIPALGDSIAHAVYEAKRKYPYFFVDSTLLTGFTITGATPSIVKPTSRGETAIKGLYSSLSDYQGEIEVNKAASKGVFAVVNALPIG